MIYNIKLFHWSTLSYSEHMASDELFEELTKKIDTLIESFLQTRIPIKSTIQLNTNKNAFLKKMKEFKIFLNMIHSSLAMGDEFTTFNGKDLLIHIPKNMLKECLILGQAKEVSMVDVIVAKSKLEG